MKTEQRYLGMKEGVNIRNIKESALIKHHVVICLYDNSTSMMLHLLLSSSIFSSLSVCKQKYYGPDSKWGHIEQWMVWHVKKRRLTWTLAVAEIPDNPEASCSRALNKAAWLEHNC